MEEQTFISSGKSLKDAQLGKLFGKPCFKINGKAFTCFFENEMVFKLDHTQHSQAMQLKGAKLFDPSARNSPMKEWVQVPFIHAHQWPELARLAYGYVKGLSS
ncbi:MAG: hypothetical protein RIQ89_1239 [Bacteroidota bacterium]|jgi:hypothetical protein